MPMVNGLHLYRAFVYLSRARKALSHCAFGTVALRQTHSAHSLSSHHQTHSNNHTHSYKVEDNTTDSLVKMQWTSHKQLGVAFAQKINMFSEVLSFSGY